MACLGSLKSSGLRGGLANVPVKPAGPVGLGSDDLGESMAAVGNMYNIDTRKKVLKRRKQYVDKLDKFSLDAGIALKAPQTKNKQDCPATKVGDKFVPWKAYLLPEENNDKILKEQWSITRRDPVTGRPMSLYCYPDKFDGQKMSFADDNKPVDLGLYKYVTPAEVTKSLKTLAELLMPDTEDHERQRKQAQAADLNIKRQMDLRLVEKKREAVSDLCKLLVQVGSFPTSRKNKVAKTHAQMYIDAVHQSVLANIESGLNDPSSCPKGEEATRTINGVTRRACVPKAIYNEIATSTTLISISAKKKVEQFLEAYTQTLLNLVLKQKPADVEDAYFKIRNRIQSRA